MKKGDIVRCNLADDSLTLNKLYKIVSVNEGFIVIRNDKGSYCLYYKYRFENETRIHKLKRILNEDR